MRVEFGKSGKGMFESTGHVYYRDHCIITKNTGAATSRLVNTALQAISGSLHGMMLISLLWGVVRSLKASNLELACLCCLTEYTHKPLRDLRPLALVSRRLAIEVACDERFDRFEVAVREVLESLFACGDGFVG